jgi:ribulose-5-phosphate 4-epimerase/fuculose-1-phosphate aldolase
MTDFIVGRTVDEAAYIFSSLDRACEVQLLVEAAAANGIPKSIISDEDAAYTARTTQNRENIYMNVCHILISADSMHKKLT